MIKKCGIDVGLMLLKNYVFKELPETVTRGLGDAGIKYFSGLGFDLYQFSDSAIQGFIKTAEGATVYMTKHGISIKAHYITDGKSFVEKTLKVDISHRVDNQIKSMIWENAADWVASQKGYTLAEGFTKGSTSTHGIDRIYRDTNGNLVIVEAKFTSKAGDVSADLFGESSKGLQMTDEWVDYAIDEMLKQKTIDQDLAKELKSVVGTDKLKKEFVVVQNVEKDTTTIDKSIVDAGIGFNDINIIKIGDVVPKNA